MKLIRALACFLLLAANGSAQEKTAPITIIGFRQQLSLAGNISCLIDSNRFSSISQIAEMPFTVSFDSLVHRLNQSPSSQAFWLKCRLLNNTDSALALYVYCGDLDYIDLYFISAGQLLQFSQGGSLRSAKGHSFTEQNSSTRRLELRPHEPGELYVKIVQRTEEFNFDGIYIYDKEKLNAVMEEDYERNRHFINFQILFQGILICQLLYVLFQWLIIRRKEYLYYLFYLVAIALYFLSKYESVLSVSLLFTRYPILSVYLNKTLIILSYFFYFRFIRSFLELDAHYARMNKWIIRIEYFLLVYLLADLTFIIMTFNVRLQRELYTYILSGVFIIAASFIIYLFRQRQTLIYYILSGSFSVGLGNITGLILTYLQDNKDLSLGLPYKLLYSQIGIMIEIICFTAGLSYKNKLVEQEKIRSQEKLIEQLKANEQLQFNMQGIRNKIAQDLHDDIGSTLSSISILSDLALKEKDPGQTLETMTEIKGSSINLMEKMDDIVWSINPRNDSLENLLMRIKRFATTLFEARNIDYSILIRENTNEVKLPMEYRQHIYLILKEAINNLVKYADADQAEIEIKYHDKNLEIRVQDNGKGFVMPERFTGNGILSMKSRASLMNADLQIDSAAGKGTRILLSIKIE